uniref:Uncharacterized protein n=1 Tax=Oryza meridionalis TaxID=40149 RepID=A0A0E0EXZ2_9ORYZ
MSATADVIPPLAIVGRHAYTPPFPPSLPRRRPSPDHRRPPIPLTADSSRCQTPSMRAAADVISPLTVDHRFAPPDRRREQQVQDITLALALALASLEVITWDKTTTHVKHAQLHGLHSSTIPFSKLCCTEQQVQDITLALALALASLEVITWDKTTTHVKHAQSCFPFATLETFDPFEAGWVLGCFKGITACQNSRDVRIKSQLMIKKMGDRGVQ